MEVIVKSSPKIEIELASKVVRVESDNIVIDSALSTESENPVQNKVITVALNEKVDKVADDYYPQLAVGLADNLSGVDVVDSEVNFRRSGGGAISDGVARIEVIKGNSVVWNQLIPRAYKSVTHNGVTYTVNDDGSVVANGTASEFSYCSVLRYGVFTSRKYCVIGGADNSSSSTYYFGDGNNLNLTLDNIIIANPLKDATVTFAYRVLKGVTVENVKFAPPILIDLTKMFGAGYEPTTIEEFYSRIPMGVDLNAYNEGEVIHMDVQSIESQGVNAWDESLIENGYISDADGEIRRPDISSHKHTGFVRVLPNTQYYIRTDATSGIWGAWYDKDKNYISGLGGVGPHESPSNAEYMRMTVAYNNDGNPDTFCINLSDTSINGKYFPYIKRVEDLAVIRKYFPEGMKSAGSAHDEIRFNKASGKWEYSKGKIKSVDMGTLNWVYNAPVEGRPYGYLNTNIQGRANGKSNILCDKYIYANANLSQDKSIYGLAALSVVIVVDSAYTDAATFKAAMAGVMLYYEAADWEWVELDAEDQFRDLDYQVWNCGTEKAIAEGKSAPLAADITYGFNAIGKIKELEQLVKTLTTQVASLTNK